MIGNYYEQATVYGHIFDKLRITDEYGQVVDKPIVEVHLLYTSKSCNKKAIRNRTLYYGTSKNGEELLKYEYVTWC